MKLRKQVKKGIKQIGKAMKRTKIKDFSRIYKPGKQKQYPNSPKYTS